MGHPVVKGSFNLDRKTETADTEIVQLVPPAMRGAKTRVTLVNYVCGATAHTLTFMKALAKTTTTASAIAGATSLALTSASFLNQTIAANDFIVVQHTDGTYGAYKVSALTTLTVTIPALSAAVSSGAPVWIMGATGEAEHLQILVTASVRNNFESSLSGIATTGYRSVYSSTVYSRSGNDDPMIVHSNNATAAGFLENVSGYYGSP